MADDGAAHHPRGVRALRRHPQPGLPHPRATPLDHWLEPVFEAAPRAARSRTTRGRRAPRVAARCSAAFVAFARRHRRSRTGCTSQQQGRARAARSREAFPGLYRLAPRQVARRRALRRDRRSAMVDALAETFAAVDKCDRRRHPRAASPRWSSPRSGTVLRAFQNGVVHVYAAVMVVGLGGLGWFFVVPHAERDRRRRAGDDDYVVTAAPGLGYALPLGRGRRRQAGHRRTSAPTRAVKLHLEPGRDSDREARSEERVRARQHERRSHRRSAASAADVALSATRESEADDGQPRRQRRATPVTADQRLSVGPQLSWGWSWPSRPSRDRRALLRQRRARHRGGRGRRARAQGARLERPRPIARRWPRCSRSSSCACGPATVAAADAAPPTKWPHLLTWLVGLPDRRRGRDPLPAAPERRGSARRHAAR